jgi:FkbM family methyltransferase
MNIKNIIKTSRENIIFQKHPLKFMFAIFLMKIGLSKFFKIYRKQYVLRFFPTPFSRTLWIEPDYWNVQDDFFNSYIKKNDKIIDVGANIGTITLTCAMKTGPNGTVYSIEPNPVVFKYLQSNIKLNQLKNIRTYNNAIGDKKGTVTFSVIHSDGQSKIVEKEFVDDPIVQQGKKIEVPIRSIDDLELKESKFSLMKIDVEGYEKFVILGAKNTIKNVNCIYFEVIPKNYKKYDYAPKEIFDFLISEGFQLFIISKGKKITPIKTNFNRHVANVLAIRKIDDFLERTKFILEDEK